jgi:arylsulfatase A
LPAGRPLDGRSIASILREGSGESPHEYLYHQWNRIEPVLETVPGDPERKASWSIRDRAGYKLHSSGELFDLRTDPGEKNNIAGHNADKAAELRREFGRWFAGVTDRKYERVPIEVGRPDENPVEIDLTWGDPTGKVKPQYRHYNRDTIDNWTDENETVRWKIDVLEPGDYELILSYGCEPRQAGSRGKFQVGGSSAEYTFTETAGRMVFATRSAGRLRLAHGPATLEVKPIDIKGTEMPAIHKIWLRRL